MIQLNNLCKQRKELIEVSNNELQSILGGGILSSIVPPRQPLPSPITLPTQPTENNTPFVVPTSINPLSIRAGDGRGNVFEVKEGGLSYENNGNGGGIQFAPGYVGVVGKITF
jgi:hypothetical protein